MKKVIVIGSPGSGKSTFARALAEKTGLPLCHLDLLWHKPDRTTFEREEFDEKLRAVLSGDEWIIDGNYKRTIELRLAAADTVYFFDLPTEVCIEGVRSRIGKPRPDMPWVEEKFDREFLEYIESFSREQSPKIKELLSRYRDSANIIVFNSRREADDHLKELSL